MSNRKIREGGLLPLRHALNSPPTLVRSGFWVGLSWAFMWARRIQLAYIYLNSPITKVGVPSWSEGSAVYYVTRGELFGAGEVLQPVVHWATSMPLIALALAWGTIVAELLLGVLLLIPYNGASRVALVLGVALHAAIITVMGLFSFGLIMIATNLIATSNYVGNGWPFTRCLGRQDRNTTSRRERSIA